jgi:uncharacterized protein
MAIMALSADAERFHWLLVEFVERTKGVRDAVAVSSDGLLLAASSGRTAHNAEQLAAIVAGLTSLANGAARCFGLEALEQVIVEMSGGYLFVAAIGDGSNLGLLTESNCDVGLIGYEMMLLLNQAGQVLTPALVRELKNALVA